MLVKIHDQPTGYELDALTGFWAVTVPETTTNLFTDPSFEAGITGWTYSGCSGAQSSAIGTVTRGKYSLAVTPAAATGVSFASFPVTTVNGTTYTWSLDLIPATRKEQFTLVVLNGATVLASYDFIAGVSRAIDRPAVTFKAAGTTTTLRIYKRSATTALYYLDAMQLENKAYSTTYCDGDIDGCAWSGRPNHSTSYRQAGVPGGRKLSFKKDLRFRVSSSPDAGMSPIELVTQEYAQLGGGAVQSSYAKMRPFSLAGAFTANSLGELHIYRRDLIAALAPDSVSRTPKPLIVSYQPTDETTGLPLENSTELQILCYFANGLKGQFDSLYQEKLVIEFLDVLPPAWRERTPVRSELSYSTTGWATYFFEKDLRTGVTSGYVDLEGNGFLYNYYDRENDLYGMLSAGVAKWDGTTIYAPSGGACRTMVDDVNRNLYIGGGFTSPQSRLAKYNKNTSLASAFGPGGFSGADEIKALCFDNLGRLWVGGVVTNAFTNLAYTDNGGAWSFIDTPAPNGAVYSLAMGADGKLYAGGLFTSIGGTACDRIARLNFNTGQWESLSVSFAGGALLRGVYKIVAISNGSIAINCDFTSINGTTFKGLALYDGAAWSPLIFPSVATITSGAGVTALASDGTTFYIGTESGIMRYNGLGAAVPFSLARTVNATSGYSTLAINSNGDKIAGHVLNPTSAQYSDALTTVAYTGTGATYPKFEITGPGQLWTITNYTTNKTLTFDLTLVDGEVATLILDPDNFSFNSNLRGNILAKLLTGSSFGSFALQPGTNYLGVLMPSGTTASTKVVMTYYNQHWSIDGAMVA